MPDRFCCLFESFFSASAHNEMRAFGRELFGHGPAKSFAAGRHQRNLTAKTEIHI
jgi:hypothetical protein